MSEQLSSGLLADSKEFAELRSDVRDALRDVEMNFRVALMDVVKRMPPEAAVHVVGMVEEVPRILMTGHFWLYSKLSEFMSLSDMIAQAEKSEGGSIQ